MSIEFAEKIIDGMVDENGHCGERGMSTKQYRCIQNYMTEETEHVPCGSWEGFYKDVQFFTWTERGIVGKYAVELEITEHFNLRIVVKDIHRWIDEVPTFEGSEWVYEPKQRVDMELTLIRDYAYERAAYTYGMETFHIYTLADADGNCYVWKTTGHLGADVVKEVCDDGSEWLDWVPAEPGDKVFMKATVKAHDEYKGIKQTVVTRPKVKEVQKRAA